MQFDVTPSIKLSPSSSNFILARKFIMAKKVIKIARLKGLVSLLKDFRPYCLIALLSY